MVYDEGAMPHFERQRRRPREDEVNEEEDIVNLDVDDDDDDVDFTSFTNFLSDDIVGGSNPFRLEELEGHGGLQELGRVGGASERGARGLIDEDDDENWQHASPSRP